MLIAQITDLHLGFDQDVEDEYNVRRLRAVLARLSAMDPRPDLLMVTGDIADRGDDRISYRRYGEAIAGLPFPVFSMMGNHDSRPEFMETFPDHGAAGGFVQYAIEDRPVRIIALDSLEPGRHGGNFCEERAEWLRARLDEAPDRPTMIAIHHPPIDTGIPWLTENPSASWIARLRGVIEGRDNVVAMIAGHVHRPLTTMWTGVVLAVCSSTSPQLAVDLWPIDPEWPDDRDMILDEPPAFALHRWDGERIVTHFDTIDDHEVLARYTPRMQPLVRKVCGEKRDIA